MLKISSPAKVNLVLEVLGLRQDGYHEVSTLLQTVGMYDYLEMETGEELVLSCQPKEHEGPNNLVWRAAQLLKHVSGSPDGANINLVKNIPESAGLGGGSSDAAATLLALRRIWGVEIANPLLKDLAARIGSDVPFFIEGGLAIASGKGEQVRSIPRRLKGFVIIVLPSLRIPKMKTQRAYENLSQVHYTDGSITTNLAVKLEAGDGITTSEIYNVFDTVSEQLYPGITVIRTKLEHACGCQFHLAGSGPALFTLCPSRIEAESRAHLIQGMGVKVWVCAFSRGIKLLNSQG